MRVTTRSTRRVIEAVAALLIVQALVPTPALAYIDPIAGSLFLQALIAGILGALLGIKRVGFVVKGKLLQAWRRLIG